MNNLRGRIFRRILSFLLTLLIVSLFVFLSISLSMGDSSAVLLNDEASEMEIEEYRRNRGLDRSVFERYLSFLKSFVTLSWGKSVGGESIKKVVFERLPVTLSLSFYSILFSSLFSFFIVLFALRKRGGGESPLITVISSIFMVIPSFLTSLFLVLIFSMGLKLFPVSGYKSINEGYLIHFRSLFLPSLTLSFLHASLMMRVLYSALDDSLSMPYTRTSLSKGVKERNLVFSSALKPTLPIFFTLVSDSLASAFGGSAVVESVFALPGLGSLMVKGALERDAETVATAVLVVAFLVSFVFLISDIASDLSDPRRRRSDEKD